MNSEQMSYSIVLACDEAYAMPLATTLRSIVEANQSNWPINFHVFSDGIKDASRKKVFDSLPKDSALIQWVEVDLSQFRGFLTLSHISKVTYARLLIPTIFSDTVSRVLYLDADILVLDELGPLFATDMEGAAICAVLDLLDPLLKAGKPELEKLPRVMNYFNAGVLLIDLVQWRKQRISEKGLEYLYKKPLSPFSDQDALNFACNGLWKKLDDRWNFQKHLEVSFSDISEFKRPGIVHFVTIAKPWNARIPNLNKNFYDSFRSRTCFARSPSIKLRDFLIEIWIRLKSYLMQYALFSNTWSGIKSCIEQ